MKLLFDQNVSPDMVVLLADLFPGSQHVFAIGLDQQPDWALWEYARSNDFVIVSKDQDYSMLALLRGFPPKVLSVRTGNCTTQFLEQLIRRKFILIKNFENDPDTGILGLR